MSGSGITLKVDNPGVIEVLNEILRRGQNLRPALEMIAEEVLQPSTRERFDTEEAPDGTKWMPLSPEYQARKKKNADKILTLEAFLRESFFPEISDTQLLFGTDKIQAATHQFGRPVGDGEIPARPFLGISDDDERHIIDILQTFLLEGK